MDTPDSSGHNDQQESFDLMISQTQVESVEYEMDVDETNALDIRIEHTQVDCDHIISSPPLEKKDTNDQVEPLPSDTALPTQCDQGIALEMTPTQASLVDGPGSETSEECEEVTSGDRHDPVRSPIREVVDTAIDVVLSPTQIDNLPNLDDLIPSSSNILQPLSSTEAPDNVNNEDGNLILNRVETVQKASVESSAEWIEAPHGHSSNPTCRTSLLPIAQSNSPVDLTDSTQRDIAVLPHDLPVEELKEMANSVMAAMSALMMSNALAPDEITQRIDEQMKKLQTIKELISKAGQSTTPKDTKPTPKVVPPPIAVGGWEDDDYTQFSTNLLSGKKKSNQQEDDWEGFGTADCANVLTSIAGASKPTLQTPSSARRMFNSLEVVAKSDEARAYIQQSSNMESSAERKKQVFRRKLVSPARSATSDSATTSKALDNIYEFEAAAVEEDRNLVDSDPASSTTSERSGGQGEEEWQDADWHGKAVVKGSKPSRTAATMDHVHTKTRRLARPSHRKLQAHKRMDEGSEGSDEQVDDEEQEAEEEKTVQPKKLKQKKETHDDSLEDSPPSRRTSKPSNVPMGSPLAPSDPSCPLFEYNLPSSFLQNVPTVWAYLWKTLEYCGWYWTKGRGLIDFYYVRPNAKPDSSFVLDYDYFASQQAVEEFIRNIVHQVKKDRGLLAEEDNGPSSRAHRGARIATVKGDDQSSNRSSSKDSVNSLEKPKAGKSVAVKEKTRRMPSTSSRAVLFPPKGDGDDDDDEDEDNEEEEERFNIREIPWKDLWKVLRSLGWTWEFGPNHLNYFYAPGYSHKQDKQAVSGVHKFTTEDEVRRFIRREIRAGRGDPWPMFYLEEGKGTTASQSQSQSQAMEGEWELIKHRKKRDVAAVYTEHHSEDEASRGAGSASKREAERSSGQKPSSNSKQKDKEKSKARDLEREQDKERSSSAGRGGSAARGMQRQDSLRAVVMEEFTQKQILTPPRKHHRPHEPFSPDSRPLLALLPLYNQPAPSTGTSVPTLHSGGSGSGQKSAKAPVQRSSNSKPSILQVSEGIWSGWMIIMSGMTDDKRSALEKAIQEGGGKVTSKIPGEEELHARVVLISQPADFRKPKYVQAVIQGISILHFKWVEDSLAERSVLPVDGYRLPSLYSALHSHFLFTPSHPRPSSPLLRGLKVMNLTGQKTWDDLLLAAGAIVLPSDEATYSSLLTLRLRDFVLQKDTISPADILLFDPAVYVRSLCVEERSSLARIGVTALHGSSAAIKKPTRAKDSKKPLLSLTECQVLQHCHAMYTSAKQSNKCVTWPPLVASIDWFTHSIALREFVNIYSLDLFSLPADMTRPICYKAELDSAYVPSIAEPGTASGGKAESGERYCKYDFVYYHTDTSTHSRLQLGRINGFSRMNMDSTLLVRILTLEGVAEDVLKRAKGNKKTASPRNTEERLVQIGGRELMIAASQLAKKVVLFAPEDYRRCQEYSLQEEDVYTFRPEDWAQEWPVIDWRISSEDASQHISDGIRYEPSQDF